MLIVWYKIRDDREAIVIAKGVEHATRYDMQYAAGLAAPHYPLPVTLEHAAQCHLNDWRMLNPVWK